MGCVIFEHILFFMINCVSLKQVLSVVSCIFLLGCGEEQFQAGVSLGGTGQPTPFGGGTLPVVPLPSLDEDLSLEERYVVWAPEAHTQECDGLDIALYVINQSNLEIVEPGYGTDLIKLPVDETKNLQLRLQILNQSDTSIVQVDSCEIELSSSNEFNNKQSLSCHRGNNDYLPNNLQVFDLNYSIPEEEQVWNLNYRMEFRKADEKQYCELVGIPLSIEKF